MIDNYINHHLKLNVSDYIRPVCLPDSFESDHIDDPVTITGWGKTWAYSTFIFDSLTVCIKRTINNLNLILKAGERSPVLLKARLKDTTSWRCSKMLPNYFDTDSVICIDGLHYDSKSTNPCEVIRRTHFDIFMQTNGIRMIIDRIINLK